ncbi:uncharacterized protein [Thunnus thynnus]|uniref:uncharacterized protein n=1 Tax=Thunnus thynnus TaxID=8237 RepID=UPI003528F3D4
MSDRKQRRLQKVGQKGGKRDDGSDLNQIKQVHAGHVCDPLTSDMSKPVSHEHSPPKTDRLTRKQRSYTVHAGSGKVVSTNFPPLPVITVSPQQAGIWSRHCLASRFKPNLQRSQQRKHVFEELKLPVIPAVVKQNCGNKEGSQMKLPSHLPQIHVRKPEMSVPKPTTVQHSLCKLPVIENTPVKRLKPKTVNLHRPICVLPSISGGTEELDRSFKLPVVGNMQKAESPRKNKAKK